MNTSLFQKIQSIRNEIIEKSKNLRSEGLSSTPQKKSEFKNNEKPTAERARTEELKRFDVNDVVMFNCSKDKTNRDKDVLDTKLGFPNYINVLNSFRNPDIMTGDTTKFLKGNKYRAKMANRNEEIKDQGNNTEVKNSKLQNPEENGSESEESSDDAVPSRYYHKESKGVRCRNCMEIGHMARNWPNHSKIPTWRYCGTSHELADVCPSQKWYKCNKAGHKASEWNSKELTYWK